MVKAGAKLISSFSNENTEISREWRHPRNSEVMPSMSVVLDLDSVEVRFAMGLGDCIGSLDVCMSPLKFFSNKA